MARFPSSSLRSARVGLPSPSHHSSCKSDGHPHRVELRSCLCLPEKGVVVGTLDDLSSNVLLGEKANRQGERPGNENGPF